MPFGREGQPLPGTSNEEAWLDTKTLRFQGLQDANYETPKAWGPHTTDSSSRCLLVRGCLGRAQLCSHHLPENSNRTHLASLLSQGGPARVWG